MDFEKEDHLGVFLEAAMKAKGVTQAEVAREFKVKAPSVADWRKYGRIDKKHYPHLVEYFGLPYEWWFGSAKVDRKVLDVVYHMQKMNETQKDEVVKTAFSSSEPNHTPNHGSAKQ